MTDPDALAAAVVRANEAEASAKELLARLERLENQNTNINRLQDAAATQAASMGHSPRLDHYRVPKLPPFSQVDPALWFIQAEISMRNANIRSSSTKSDIVLAALDVEVLGCVRDIITASPPPNDIFEQVKQRIIATYAVSEEAKLRKLLKGQVGTDGKPSLVLSRLRNLSNGMVDDNVIRQIFLDQLPQAHRAILVASGATDLNKIAEAADRIVDSSLGTDYGIAAIAKHTPVPFSVDSDIKDIKDSILALTKKVEKMEAKLNRRGSRSFSRNRDKQEGKGKNGNNASSLCPAHTSYPDNPTSCRAWCSKFEEWKKQNQKN